MTIEATLSEVLTTLRAIHTSLASGAAVAPTAAATATAEPPAAAAPAAEKAPRKPREVSTSPAATEAKPAATPAAAKATDWKNDVMPVLLEINKSTKPGHGRDGLMGLITKFLGDATKKIPDLEKLGKHDEVLAAAKALLAGEPVAAEAEDELGLGI